MTLLIIIIIIILQPTFCLAVTAVIMFSYRPTSFHAGLDVC